jgi:hypothetical protein
MSKCRIDHSIDICLGLVWNREHPDTFAAGPEISRCSDSGVGFMWRLTLVVLIVLSLIDRVHAAEPPLNQKDATVVINGQREVLEKQLFEFVKNVTHSASTDDPTEEAGCH